MNRWSDVRYARTPDGVHLAYQEAGTGPPLLLLIEGFVPIEDMDDEPRLSAALSRIGTFSHAIRFDRRGIGLSDPSPRDAPPTLEQWLDDVETVLDAAGVGEAVVVGDRGGALIGLGLAALRPRRVHSLVVVNGFARFMAADDHPHGADPAFMVEVGKRLFDTQHPEGPFDIIGHLAPSAAEDTRFREWWDRAGRRGASPSTARALRAVIESLDLRALLPEIRTPLLVIHRDAATIPSVEQGRYIAERVPGARYVEVPGPDAVWYVGETAQMLDEIEHFVTGSPHRHDQPDETMTVLFTDIVDSTSRAAALGDTRWSQLFDRYEAAAHRSIGQRGGSYVKSTGDGSLAVFDGPVRAVEAARELRSAAADLGLPIRTALHTGAVEQRGRDIAGLAVHVAARVLGAAGEGEILITDATARLLSGAPIGLTNRGEHNLRGVPGTWTIYSVA
jgi:class 3 adenylate cyclase/pimeloyl-ACP methyl ester carboxylesterase